MSQRIESGDEQPSTSTGDHDGVTSENSREPSTTPTTAEPARDRSIQTSEDSTAAPAAQAWKDRWFLVPPRPTEIVGIETQHEIWERAQRAGLETLVVTTDRSNPATAGIAWVYHLDGINMFRIGDPDGSYSEQFVGDRQVRVGEDRDSDRINAFTSSETGAFVVVAVGLDRTQAVDLVVAARLVDGIAELGDRVPADFEVVARPGAAPTDHNTTLRWGADADRFAIRLAPTTLEDAVLGLRSDRAEPVAVRGVSGVYVPAGLDGDPAALIWSENGYTLTLTKGDPVLPGDAGAAGPGVPERLVAMADSMIVVRQPELVERLDSSFMRDQAATVAGWFDATPPPKGWDVSTLIDAAPQDELRMAGVVRQFLECTWFAEWGDAVRADDDRRRTAAEAVLVDEPAWPVVIAETGALRQLGEGSEDAARHDEQTFEQRAADLASVGSDGRLPDVEQRYGCGFVVPD